jgi:hypothetical protein
MRDFYFFFLSLLFSNGTSAQDSTRFNSFQQSVDVIYGQKFLQNSVLGGTINDLSNPVFGQPLSYVGIGVTGGLAVGNKSNYNLIQVYPANFHFYHVIPQKVMVFDSISGSVSGFNFHIPFAGWDILRKKRTIDLVLGAGINTGRIRLFGDPRLEQVNAYFSPFLSITPRFIVGKISFQIKAEYELDITCSRWRKVWFSSSPKVDLGPMKSTGLSNSFAVGWVF